MQNLLPFYLSAKESRPKLLPLLVLLGCGILTSCNQKSPQNEIDIQTTKQNSAQNYSGKAIKEFQQGLGALDNYEDIKAQRIFQKFIQHYPDFPGAYVNLALIHFRKEEYAQALKLVNIAIEVNDQFAESYHLKAQLLLIDGEIHQAKDNYLTAVKLKPDHLNAHYNLALLYDIYLQEIALAVKHYEKYVSLLIAPDERTSEWINHLKNTLKNG